MTPPPHLIALSHHDHQIPLFWFAPGAEPIELGYDDGTYEYSGYVNTDWKQNQVAIKFNLKEYLPCYLESVRLFLVNLDHFPSEPGDQNSPFLLSVNRDSSGTPGRTLWGPDTLQADSQAWSDSGQWLEVPTNLFIHTDSIIWIVLYWLEQTPTAPLIGLSVTSSGFESYYTQFDGEILDWQIYNFANLMIRAKILSNSNQISQALQADSFILYRSADSTNLLSPGTRWLAVPSGTYQAVDSSASNGQSYSYAITALYAEQESSPTLSPSAVPRRGAKLSLQQTSQQIDISPGKILFDTLQIFNQGDLPLNLRYKIQIQDSSGSQISDNWGHTWKSSLNSPDLHFNWVSIEEDSNLIAQNSGDDTSWGPFALNFPFLFYGNNFDSVRICSNGFISFTSHSTQRDNTTLPYSGGRFNLIAPFWDDLALTDSSKIYFKSGADTALVSFVKLGRFGAEASYTFQLILDSKGGIVFQYGELSGVTNSVTIGIQNYNGSDGLLLAYNEDFQPDSLVIKIPAPWIQLAAYPTQLSPGESKELNLKVSSEDLSLGQQFAKILFWGEDSAGIIPPQDFQLTLNVDTLTSVESQEQLVLPSDFRLEQNFPNPFNNTTWISYTLKNAGFVSLKTFNLRGELVATLVNRSEPAGTHQVTWNGKNNRGEAVASGVYFYQLRAGENRQTRKLTLLK